MNFYSVYFDFFTQDEWVARRADYEAEKKRQQAIENSASDNFQGWPGAA